MHAFADRRQLWSRLCCIRSRFSRTAAYTYDDHARCPHPDLLVPISRPSFNHDLAPEIALQIAPTIHEAPQTPPPQHNQPPTPRAHNPITVVNEINRASSQHKGAFGQAREESGPAFRAASSKYTWRHLQIPSRPTMYSSLTARKPTAQKIVLCGVSMCLRRQG